MKQDPRKLTDFFGLTGTYSTVHIDPPWRFLEPNWETGARASGRRRYETMSFQEIGDLTVSKYVADKAHLYMWCPNALLLAV